ncbi:MAG: copper resistance protein B [Gammaproteobacteria bacterium]|nr:copper resistance protein B [Gammaproteobacteria bacterium]
MKLKWFALSLLWLSSAALAQDGIQLMDKNVFYMLDVEELELTTFGDSHDYAWDADFWAGTDLNRLWIKTKGEAAAGGNDHSELQILYSRAIAPFWNLQAGVRHEFEPKPEQNAAVLAVEGLAPYGFEVEAELLFADGGPTTLRLRTNYELLLTQRLILTPEAELTAYSGSDALRGTGSGLGRIEIGLRLRYEYRREFAPYIGLYWVRLHGETGDLAVLGGHNADDLELVAGLRFWY